MTDKGPGTALYNCWLDGAQRRGEKAENTWALNDKGSWWKAANPVTGTRRRFEPARDGPAGGIRIGAV